MIARIGQINPTQAIGMASYAATACVCFFAWLRAKQQGKCSRLPAFLAVLEAALFLDIVFSWRWMLHDFLSRLAERAHAYEFRHGPQVIALVVLAALLLLLLLVVQRLSRASKSARLAVSGALLSMGVWCAEVVSLHAVDHILYHEVGPWMIICAFWIAACSITCIGMWPAASQAHETRGSQHP